MKKLALVTVGLLLCSCSFDVNAEEGDEGDSIYVISGIERDDDEYSEVTKMTDQVVADQATELFEIVTPGALIYLPTEVQEIISFKPISYYDPSQPHLTKSGGVFYGPTGKEKYYNLNMSGVVQIMRNMGYSEEEYPYWVRDDGAKMLGDYVMVAANLSVHPRGTTVETSLGTGLVCDKCEGAYYSDTVLDLAVNW